MKNFTRLFGELDQTTRTNEKVAALERYFSQASNEDAAWALFFLSGRTLSRMVPSKQLWQWVADETALPSWLIEECYDAVGDMAESIALLLSNSGEGLEYPLTQLIEQRLLPLPNLSDSARRASVIQTWRELGSDQLLIWNKIITGNFRIGVSRTLVIRALANVARIEPAVMAHRVMGQWHPTAQDFQRLLSQDTQSNSIAKPYPFFLASPLEIKIKRGETMDRLGDIADWQMEWKWDGIRAQLIHRRGETLLWSRGDELITQGFPEIIETGDFLPDGVVLDGELLAWRGESPLPFAALQHRLGRKTASMKIRNEFPVEFVAYDLLEYEGLDCRAWPLTRRRHELEKIVSALATTAPKMDSQQIVQTAAPFLPGFDNPSGAQKSHAAPCGIRLSPLITPTTWSQLAEFHRASRGRGVEGLMLKKKDSIYGVGRQRGDWWKWKIDPFLIDAVLVAAQSGHGRRASLYTDYTFALWENGKLVPMAKAYSGLSDEEILQVDAFVRQNISERFGPVRSVKPLQVFELAFEGVQQSARHKSGIAVRFPRINRWRRDKKPEEADTMENLRALAKLNEPSS